MEEMVEFAVEGTEAEAAGLAFLVRGVLKTDGGFLSAAPRNEKGALPDPCGCNQGS